MGLFAKFQSSLLAPVMALLEPLSAQLTQVQKNTETIMTTAKDVQAEEQIIEGDVAALKTAAQANAQKLTDLGTQITTLQGQVAAAQAAGQDTTTLDAILAGLQGVHASLTDVTTSLTPAPAPSSSTPAAPAGETPIGG